MEALYLILLLIIMGLSLAAQGKVQRTYEKYAQQPTARGLSAYTVAQRLLEKNGSSVQITQVQGTLTDHFDPRTGQVGLSQSVYGSTSVAAVAVAAHEIGHVLQYQEGYGPIKLRNAILPVASFGSQAAPWIVILGLMLGFRQLALVGVVLYGAMLLFQLATLPVEFNASSRALRMLEEGNFISYDESDAAKKVLNAAAMTYVYAALAALISFLRLLAIVNRGRRRR